MTEPAGIECVAAAEAAHVVGDLSKSRLRHKAEIPLFVISAVISVAVYAFLVLVILNARSNKSFIQWLAELWECSEDTVVGFVEVGWLAVLLIVVFSFIYIVWKLIEIQGRAITRDIPYSQPRLHSFAEDCAEYCEKLGISNVPRLFATCDEVEIEIFGATFKSRQYIRIGSDAAKQPYDADGYDHVVRFYIARELGHIYLGHANAWLFLLTLPARLIPLFGQAFDRAMNYSADRVALAFLGKEACVSAIALEGANPEMTPYLDSSLLFRQDLAEEPTFVRMGATFENLSSRNSVPALRIRAIELDSRSGKLL